MNITYNGLTLWMYRFNELKGARMNFEVYYTTRWIKTQKFCGGFPTLELANKHVSYLESKLPNGKKIVFKIVTSPYCARV